MSLVFLLPPIENASGAKKVSTDVTTYLSPISNSSFIIWNISTKPTIMTISHFAPELIVNILSSGMVTSNTFGISSNVITLPVIPKAISHICRDASRRNPNTKVFRNICFGSSLSKPIPDIIDFMDWKTILASSNPQLSAIMIFTISLMTGAIFSKYDKSILITFTSSLAP